MRIEAVRSEATVTVKCTKSGAEQLQKLLEHIQSIGNIGHSFEILVDPNDPEFRDTFFWDGDGSDGISDIEVEVMEIED